MNVKVFRLDLSFAKDYFTKFVLKDQKIESFPLDHNNLYNRLTL